MAMIASPNLSSGPARLAWMVGKIACIVFVIEAVIMLFFGGWPVSRTAILDGLLDATLLTLISSPFIYLWVARPFANEASAARIELKAQLAEATQLLRKNTDLSSSLQALSASNADVHERMLQKIGAELHDGPAQALTFSLLQIDRLLKKSNQDEASAVATELYDLRKAIDDTVQEIRGISTGLALPELHHLGFRDVVELAVRRHERLTKAAVNVEIAGNGGVSLSQKACLYRLIQESLVNAHKHGKATRVQVRASVEGVTEVCVIDNGQGFDLAEANNKGLGLTGMRARVEALGGDFDVTTSPGNGTKIRARFDGSAAAKAGS